MAGILEIRRGSSGISLNDGELYLNRGIQSVQIGSGSSVITLVPLNKLISGDILVNGNVFANNLTGSGATAVPITTNTTVGGILSGSSITAGTDITNLFQQLLISYIQPTTSGLSLFNGIISISSNTREVGEPFTFNRYTYSSAADSNGAYAINGSITMSGATNGTDFIHTGPSVLTANVNINLGSTITPTRNSPGAIIYTLNAKKPDNSAFISSSVTTFDFRYKNVLAASSVDVVDNSTAQTVYNSVVYSELTNNVNWTAVTTIENNNTTKYTYIVYPSTYNDITQILQNGMDVTKAFDKLGGTYSITNTYGITTSYKIYKSTQPGAYAAGINLTIS